MSSRVDTVMGTLVVRAWAERGSAPSAVRARVLLIDGPNAEARELGVVAGLDAILELVAEGLAQGLSLTTDADLS